MKTVMASVAGLAVLGLSQAALADISGGVVKIGVMNDQSGIFSTSSGQGSVLAARMAAEDFGGKAGGARIEIVFADHQNKADVGASIARRWFDEEGVDAVVDLGNSAVALAVVELAKQRNKAALISSGGTTDLTGKACTPITVHWAYDSYSIGNAVATELVRRGGKDWFFMTADYNYGKNLEESTASMVKAAGGSVLGAARFPLGTPDFASYILQAQSSKAKVIGIAAGGDDVINSLKQSNEFGLTKDRMVVAVNGMLQDFKATGVKVSQGAITSEPYYWDLNDGTRAWAARFSKQMNGQEASFMQAGVYGVVLHYLKAVDKVKDDSGKAAVDAMKALPTDDPLFGKGTIRPDGRKLHPMYVFQVKTPEESKSPWDMYKLLGTVPAEQAFKPMKDGGCPLVQ